MSDSEDEALDWAAVSTDAGVLKRGEKDHGPDGTLVQLSTLERGRDAMYRALAKPAASAAKHLVECDWDDVEGRGIVRKVKGTHFKSIGWAERTTTYVFPEELVYLVQRGSMVCFYNNRPLAVDAVMALALPSISTDFLLVYAHLKRLGYAVRRPCVCALDRTPSQAYKPQVHAPPVSTTLAMLVAGPWLPNLAWKPFYASYSSVYADLRWVHPSRPLRTSNTADSCFDFLVWKPSTEFKRSRPPAPDFRIKVVSADEPVPVLSELGEVLSSVTAQQSTKRSAQEKMQQGLRNFVYAVVDNGVVSFVRMTDSPVEPLY